jgi:hypothetical protein
MGLHAGVCEERDGDCFGPAVNRAARLLAVASGGQVLVSGVAAELLCEELPDGAGLRELGTRQLKDLTRPERIYQVKAAFLATQVAGQRAIGRTTPEASRPRQSRKRVSAPAQARRSPNRAPSRHKGHDQPAAQNGGTAPAVDSILRVAS